MIGSLLSSPLQRLISLRPLLSITSCVVSETIWPLIGHNMDTRWTYLSSSWLQPFIVINMSIYKSFFLPKVTLAWLMVALSPSSLTLCLSRCTYPILSKSMLKSHSGYSWVLATPSWWPLYQSTFAQLLPLQVVHGYKQGFLLKLQGHIRTTCP